MPPLVIDNHPWQDVPVDTVFDEKPVQGIPDSGSMEKNDFLIVNRDSHKDGLNRCFFALDGIRRLITVVTVVHAYQYAKLVKYSDEAKYFKKNLQMAV